MRIQNIQGSVPDPAGGAYDAPSDGSDPSDRLARSARFDSRATRASAPRSPRQRRHCFWAVIYAAFRKWGGVDNFRGGVKKMRAKREKNVYTPPVGGCKFTFTPPLRGGVTIF